MTKKSLFGKIADALREPEEESAEDIDKDVEAAVAEIASQKATSLDADTVLHSTIGQAGDTVFVMDLNPIFSMIGGVNGRAAQGVLECCDREFKQHKDDPLDRGIVEIDKFIMRFAKLKDDVAIQRAAIIVNAIGVHVLSERFNKMEVPDILIAADAGDITDADGKLNTGKLDLAIAKGGKPIVAKPSDDDPVWVKLRFRKKVQEIKILKSKQETHSKEPEWIEGISSSKQRKLTPRSGKDRRHKRVAHPGGEQRSGTLERRGRGY